MMKAYKTLMALVILLLGVVACSLPGFVAAPAKDTPTNNQPFVQQIEVTAVPSLTSEIPTEAVPLSSPTPELPQISLIGRQSLALGEAGTFIQSQGGFVVTVNDVTTSTDLVLFTINTSDGPMPETRQQIENLVGKTISRAAILLIGTDLQSDAELEQLVLLETREILSGFLPEEQVNRLEVLRMPDSNIGDKLRAFLILPPSEILIDSKK